MKPFFRKKNADPIVEEIAQTVQDAQYEAVTPEPENVAPVTYSQYVWEPICCSS